jgi:hypothetical protein
MRAVGRTERVIHEEVTELGERTRESRIVRLLPTQEPCVLEEDHLAIGKAPRRLHGLVGVGRLDEPVARNQLTEAA